MAVLMRSFESGISTLGKSMNTLCTPRPYDGMNILGITGLTEAQQATLKALGAVEQY